MSSNAQISIGAKTKFVISTSGRVLSLKRYNLLFNLLGVDAAYIAISSGSETDEHIDPLRFSNALRGLQCLGGAISRDIKHTIIPFLDEIDPLSQSIQSVNTVIVRNGKLCGYNTDALGFMHAITEGIRRSNITITSAVCYGYGGVTSVVVSILKQLDFEVYITGRRSEEAKKRADALGALLWTPECKPQLFVNAAPVTDKPLAEAANFLEALSSCSIAFDHEMPGAELQRFCSEHGLQHIKGTDMYYPQMLEQWKLFLEDYHIPEDRIKECLISADNQAQQSSI